MLGADVLTPAHLLILVLVLVLFFGAKKLPELGRGIGSAMREFKGEISGTAAAREPVATVEASTDSPEIR